LLACVSTPLVSRAKSGIIPSPAGSTTEYHFEVGLTYASGLKNVVDQMKTNFGLEDDSSIPIGLRISAYAKTESGFGIGAGIGPCEFYNVRTYRYRSDRRSNDSYYYDDGYYSRDNYDDHWSYVIPVFADLRYYFPRTSLMAPYVRAGVAYPISGGDHLGAGTPGPVAALGAQVWSQRYVSIGIELGYDDSKVRIKSGPFHREEKVRSGEFTISVYAAF
jgi:hypothetical protein